MRKIPRPADAERPPDDAPGAGDRELLAIVRSEPRDSLRYQAACQDLVSRYQWLVVACARRYRGSPELAEDLMQVGYVGLLKAINSFDPERGDHLAAYARPSISGEIKRHFRDKQWQVHVARPVQELRLEMRSAAVELAQELQRTPREAEMAHFLNVSLDQLAEARSADSAFRPASLSAPLPGGSCDDPGELADLIGAVDERLDQVIDMEAVAVHWQQLPPEEQRVLLLRFYGNMTQADVAQKLSVSQMQVSRLERRALDHLRTAIEGTGPAGGAPG
jgi:RNA polymerase sigma-B factor